MTLGMSGVVTGAVIILNHGNVQGKVAPIMTRLIARPLSPSHSDPQCDHHLAGFRHLDVAAAGTNDLRQELVCDWRQPRDSQAFGCECDRDEPGDLLPGGIIGWLCWFPGGRQYGGGLDQPWTAFLFPSIAAVAVGGTLLSGGKGSYWGTMAGAIVLTLITSLLTTMQMPESVRRMVLGATLLVMISIYGRQRALRQ